jgi:hypothetical protein
MFAGFTVDFEVSGKRKTGGGSERARRFFLDQGVDPLIFRAGGA